MNIFVIMPALNEEKRIVETLSGFSGLPYKVVVVDDGSTDQTSKVARSFPVVVLRHELNRNQGAALQTGDEYALAHGADIIVHFDADGQFLISEIADVIKPIIDMKADVVFGSRFLGRESQMPWVKKNIYFPIARLVNFIFGGIKMTDPQSGFRALSRLAAEQIIIEQDGRAHCSEILFKVFAKKMRVKEVPVTVIYRRFGLGLGEGIKIFSDLIFKKLLK